MTGSAKIWISLLSIAAVAWAAPVAAEQSQEELFIDAHRAHQLIEEGATVIDARERNDHRRAHIPGAFNIPWQAFVSGSESGAVIADDDRLQTLLRTAGISNDRPVVIYGNWSNEGAWGEEGRLYWTLDYLGHDNLHILAGGLSAWIASDRSTTFAGIRRPSAPEVGNFTIDRREDRRISTAMLRRSLSTDQPPALIDTRERVEFDGEIKYGESRPGHIEGATHLWWRSFFDESGQLRSASDIENDLNARGINRDSTVVVYCTGGIRSGFVYAVLRSLGFENVQNYDASMWEWTRDEDAPLG